MSFMTPALHAPVWLSPRLETVLQIAQEMSMCPSSPVSPRQAAALLSPSVPSACSRTSSSRGLKQVCFLCGFSRPLTLTSGRFICVLLSGVPVGCWIAFCCVIGPHVVDTLVFTDTCVISALCLLWIKLLWVFMYIPLSLSFLATASWCGLVYLLLYSSCLVHIELFRSVHFLYVSLNLEWDLNIASLHILWLNFSLLWFVCGAGGWTQGLAWARQALS